MRRMQCYNKHRVIVHFFRCLQWFWLNMSTQQQARRQLSIWRFEWPAQVQIKCWYKLRSRRPTTFSSWTFAEWWSLNSQTFRYRALVISYLTKMDVFGTCGDHITLMAVAVLHEVQIIVLSSDNTATLVSWQRWCWLWSYTVFSVICWLLCWRSRCTLCQFGTSCRSGKILYV